MKPLVFGMDIGGTHMRSGFVDEAHQLSHFEIARSKTIQGEQVVQRLAEYIRNRISDAKMNPAAIAIGFPSALDKARKRILSTPNIAGLNGVDMVAELEGLLPFPVYIERDVNLLFLYDCYAHHLQGDVIIGCYVGTGFGNVVSIRGEILTGKNGVAAELGHIPLLGMKERCPCGNAGCAELYAAGKGLEAIRNKAFPDTPIEQLWIRHEHTVELDGFLECLSIPIATEVNILDPDDVILGGGVLYMTGFPRKRFEEALLRHVRKPYPAENLQLLYSEERQENGVIGAGILGFMQMKK